MKKIISTVLAAATMSLSLPALAYSQSDYHAKADELTALIEECNKLGINTQYEEIDANIIRVYADRVAEFEANGLASSITSFQLSDLDTLYANAKANLEGYKNGTKTAPEKVYTYKTGDGYSIDGASLKNRKGDPYFSSGFGHFSMSGHLEELNSYTYDNVQAVVSIGDIITSDRKIDSWDTATNGGADCTYEMVKNTGRSNNTSLHVVNKSAMAGGVYGTIYQRVPVKPGTEYEVSFYAKGEKAKYSALYSVDDWSNRQYIGYGKTELSDWTKYSMKFTTGEDEYFKGLRFIFEDTCDIYIDDITIRQTGSTRNCVINGGFDGDGSEDFDVFYNEKTSMLELMKTLESAEKNNTHVEVLLQLQQNMPSVIIDKYPEMNGNGRYNIDHLAAQTVEKAYVESVLGTVSDYSSLSSIIVANEPNYNSADYSYGTRFAEYLQNVYGSISSLNSVYGKSYSSFSAVGIPSEFEESARFYDYKKFNDEIFTSWYEKTVAIIKGCIPGIPVSIKAQPDFTINDRNYSSDIRNQMAMGIDMELLGEASDFHGNDSYGMYEESGTNRNAMKWYDYLNSISDKPIYDSEKHITQDGSSTYNSDITKFTKNSVWQSMIHGLDMYSIWTWELDVDTSSVRYGHLALRPAAISEAAKAALDANRLSKEVTAIANAKPEVAILRDDSSRIFNKKYMNAITLAYNAATEAGHKVGFVTPKNIGEKLSQYSILAIPYATNVEENVLRAISEFDGKIVMLDSDSLKKTAYNQSLSGDAASMASAIRSRSEIIEVTGNFTNQYKISSPSVSDLKPYFADNTKPSVTASNGSLSADVEWQYAPYKNGYVVNVCNYNTSSAKSLVLKLDGKEAEFVTSLISGEDVSANISVPKMSYDFYYVRNTKDEVNENPEEPEEDEEIFVNNEITSLTGERSGDTNILNWTAKTEGKYNVYTVNPDGTLAFVATTENNSFEQTSDDVRTYAVKCITGKGESAGKKITCGADVSAIPARAVCTNGKAELNVNYTNNEAYSIVVTITATAYNEDNSFAGAVVTQQLIPAGKTVNYNKVFTTVGTGKIVITKK